MTRPTDRRAARDGENIGSERPDRPTHAAARGAYPTGSWGKRQFRPQGRDISFIYFANILDIYPDISEKFLRFSLCFCARVKKRLMCSSWKPQYGGGREPPGTHCELRPGARGRVSESRPRDDPGHGRGRVSSDPGTNPGPAGRPFSELCLFFVAEPQNQLRNGMHRVSDYASSSSFLP